MSNTTTHSLKTINNYLFDTLDRLDKLDVNDAWLANIEIKRSNSIAQASKVIISTVKTKVDIAKLKQDNNQYIDSYLEELGIDE